MKPSKKLKQSDLKQVAKKLKKASLAWTSEDDGYIPPKAPLSFNDPGGVTSDELRRRAKANRKKLKKGILKALHTIQKIGPKPAP